MSDPKIIQLSGDGEFNMDVRGESNYQDALALLTSGRKRKDARTVKVARLIPDPTNPVDTNAVRVEIEGYLVGFLPKYLAPAYLSTLKKRKITGVIECPALIRGGFERDGELFPFGVRLDLPDALIADIAANTKEPASKKKGGGCLKWGLIGLGVFILIGIIGSFAPKDDAPETETRFAPIYTNTPATRDLAIIAAPEIEPTATAAELLPTPEIIILVPTNTPAVAQIVEPTSTPVPPVPVDTPIVQEVVLQPTNPPFTCAGGCAQPPDPSCAIKGNFNGTDDEKIFHQPGGRWYDDTDVVSSEGDVWFCTVDEARAAGYREAGSR